MRGQISFWNSREVRPQFFLAEIIAGS